MKKFNKKLRIICAAAALTLALLPVSCGTDDNNNDNMNNDTNGTNGTSSNNNIIDDAGDAIENGASTVVSDINGVDDGMTNNNVNTTTNKSTTTR